MSVTVFQGSNDSSSRRLLPDHSHNRTSQATGAGDKGGGGGGDGDGSGGGGGGLSTRELSEYNALKRRSDFLLLLQDAWRVSGGP